MKYLLITFLCFQYTLSGETPTNINDELKSDDPSSPSLLTREKRQFQHGYGYGFPYSQGYMGQFGDGGVMNPVLAQQMYPNQAGMGRGLLSTFLNPLNALGSMMGMGRSANPHGYGKHLSAAQMPDDGYNQAMLWSYYAPTNDGAYKYVVSPYMEYDEPTGKSADPVANYIMGVPWRKNVYY